MKRIMIVAVSVMLVTVLVFGASIAMAAKPQNSGSGKDVIAMSNGFPSGQHFNLNIHGKKADFDGDSTSGGKSVFTLEYSPLDNDEPTQHIQYVSNKKARVYELTVLDKYTEAFFGEDPAIVQLPYKVMVDDTPIPAEGYYVFARILGKPNNSKTLPSSNIILYPNVVVEACNDPGDNDDFPGYTECPENPELMLGLIVGDNIYVPDNEVLRRFEDPTATKGKGKSKAVDITRLFTYTGWVVDERLDIYPPAVGETPAGNGVIDDDDVPADAWEIIENAGIDPNVYDEHPLWGDNSGTINLIEEWLAFNADLATPMAWYFANHWIFDIADLVITEQGLVNDGTKLVQIRFYPVATTTFGSHIIVEKSAPGDGLTAFGFDPSYGNEFSLRHGETKDSGALKTGTGYTVTEILPLSGDWTLDRIEVIDLDPTTGWSVDSNTVNIDLAPGETVRVIFHNIPTP